MNELLNYEDLKKMIYQIRGRRVMFDFDLAKIFNYEVKTFNQNVKRNIILFKDDCMFELTKNEVEEYLRSQIVTAKSKTNALSKRRTLPFAFTTKGIIILTRLLKTKTDICKNNVDLLIDYLNGYKAIENEEKVDNKGLNYEIIKFESGNISLDVRVSPDEDTIWMTQQEIAILFDTTIPNISVHISNIFDEKELIKDSVVKKNLNTAADGKKYNVTYYSLDVILSVGYRVNSKRGTEFRRWANNILKQYLIKGYSVNTKRCLEHSDIIFKLQNETSCLINKLDEYDDKFKSMQKDIKSIKEYFNDPNTYKHYLILNGERIESDVAYQSIYKLANKSIYIIDDYIDIKTLQLLKVCSSIEIKIVTDNKAKNKLNNNFINDFKKDTGINIVLIKNNKMFHSRYIIIDFDTENYKLYLCGGSSKDGGTKINTIQELDEKELYKESILIALKNDCLKLS